VSLSDELESREQDADLRTTNLRLLRQLDKAKASKEELVDAVYRAATDAARSLVIPPVPRPERDRRRGKAEVAVAMLSDWQLGKKTPTYSSEVCEERVALTPPRWPPWLTSNALTILYANYECGCSVILSRESSSSPASLIVSTHRSTDRWRWTDPGSWGFLRSMLGAFERVHVTAVIGNHGAIGGPVRREMHPETNADTMLYRIVSQIVVDPRLTWDIADPAGERGWYAIDQIGNYRCLLFHGDQVRGGFAGFPFYGLAKKVWGWASGGLAGDFNDVALGHWHTPTRVTLNRVTARVNGSTESDNTYAQEQLASSGRPSQWLYFVEPTRGRVTAEYCVYLDD
jgi:hypothetical protein